MYHDAGTALVDASTTEEPERVRVLLEHDHAPNERLWAYLVAPGTVRLLNVSHFCDLSFGDTLEASRVCSCDNVHGVRHYHAGPRFSRGSRRVQVFTRGTSRRRVDAVAEYLQTWPTEAGGTYQRPAPSVVSGPWCPCCGEIGGLMAESVLDPDYRSTHWVLAFPLNADEERVREFLDRVPYVAFHELMPEEDE
jgi:hypothetical protein